MTLAAIIDIDGTLCDITGVLRYLDGTEYGFDKRGRPIKNFDMFHEAAAFCPVNPTVLQYMQTAADDGLALVIATARMERHRRSTTEWLRNVIPSHLDWFGPLMRPERDYRRDVDIKTDMYNAMLAVGLEPVRATDDNPSIIALWKSLGLEVTEVPRPVGDTTLIDTANQETP